MHDSQRDDANLAEVKAILGRLQRISRKPRSGGQAADDEAIAPLPLRPDHPAPAGQAGLPQPAGIASLSGAPLVVKAAVLAVPLLAIVGGVVVLHGGGGGPPDNVAKEAPTDTEFRATPAQVSPPATPVPAPVQAPVPAPTPAVKETTKSPLLRDVSDLLSAGRVQAARAALLRAMKEDSADIAWALARSYDPNFLVTISAPDATPDIAEAKRWYRTWYDIAVRQGLVSDSVSIERIIRSMQ